MHKLLTILILLLPLGPAGADIYKHVLPDGSVVFSDQPGDNATKMDSPPVQTYTAPPVPAPAAPGRITKPADQGPAYSTLSITAPAQDAVIWNNEGTVTVQIEIQPSLRTSQGDHLTLLMDGQKVVDLEEAHYTLQGVDRGTHSLQAAVMSGGKVLAESQIVQFHLKRHSVLRRTTPSN